MNNRFHLPSHRSLGLPSAEGLIALIYPCCRGLSLEAFHTR